MSNEPLQTEKLNFVNLHCHTTFSVFDGLGYPSDLIDAAVEKGMNAIALTDHGNMNGLSHFVAHAKKLEKAGNPFKAIYGVEAYFVPSLKKWKKDYKDAQEKKGAKDGVNDELDRNRKGLNSRFHIILLAKNQVGLTNLFKIVSASHMGRNFYRRPRIDYKVLRQHHEGIIATSACLGGVYARSYWQNEGNDEKILASMRKTTEKMQAIFGEDWYAELQWNGIDAQHRLNKHVITIAQEYGVQLLSACDVHYPKKELWESREIYSALKWLRFKTPEEINKLMPASLKDVGFELFVKNGEDVFESYKRYTSECSVSELYSDSIVKESINNTYKVAYEKIEAFWPDNSVKLPNFVVPEGKTADQALFEKVSEEMKLRSFDSDKTYCERIAEELDVISSCGFSKYFLTMKALADKASSVMLTGPGRGSAGGSLVAYVLGITQIDPIKYDLQFSRFLRKGADGYPDIDYDVANSFGFKEIITREWGEKNVVPVSNWNTLQIRSLLKDLSKLYGVDFQEVNDVSRSIEEEIKLIAKKKIETESEDVDESMDELKRCSKEFSDFLAKYPKIEKHISVLHGQIRSQSRHAGGIIVADNLDQHMPLIRGASVSEEEKIRRKSIGLSEYVLQTPFVEGIAGRYLEKLGLIKFDILGLSTLNILEKAIKNVLRTDENPNPSFEEVKKFYNQHLHPDVIDFRDPKVYEHVFKEGRFAGIFQFAEEGAQKFCQKISPTCLEELSDITSIYRPGGLKSGIDKLYASARENPRFIHYDHPAIEKVTKSTLGFIVYQEQIASLAHHLAGFSLEEGQTLRKIIVKKGTGKTDQKEKYHERFVDGAVANGLAKNKAEKIWETILKFASYAFNRSHGVSYSSISFQCAWFLTYHPAEWLAALLSEKESDKIIGIVQSLGYKIKTADVNLSGYEWKAYDAETLIQPLSSIKGVGEKALNELMDARPFNAIEELLFNKKIDYRRVNKKVLDALVRSRALDSIKDQRFTTLKHFWKSVAESRPRTLAALYKNIEAFKDEDEFSGDELFQFECDLLSTFPLNKIISLNTIKRLKAVGCCAIGEMNLTKPTKEAIIWGVIKEIEVKQTQKTGKSYTVVTMIDNTFKETTIRCWNFSNEGNILKYKTAYMAKLDYDPKWSWSCRAAFLKFKEIS